MRRPPKHTRLLLLRGNRKAGQDAQRRNAHFARNSSLFFVFKEFKSQALLQVVPIYLFNKIFFYEILTVDASQSLNFSTPIGVLFIIRHIHAVST